MAESIEYHQSKRLKITHEDQSIYHSNSYNKEHYSTFESLSGELILDLFEYFNTKEILQTFMNLTPLINCCIYDQRQRVHMYLDRSMQFSSYSAYCYEQVISLHIEHFIIQIDIFPNLKSLCIVHDNELEAERLNMIQQVSQLNHLVFLTFVFV
jgi:hypothetical protein